MVQKCSYYAVPDRCKHRAFPSYIGCFQSCRTLCQNQKGKCVKYHEFMVFNGKILWYVL